MKQIFVVILFFFSISLVAQSERFPVFNSCSNQDIKELESCFYEKTKKFFFENFNSPALLERENYKANVSVIFVVSSTGQFKFIFANSPYKELQDEIKRVFDLFPVIMPAKYNNHNVEMRFALPLNFPLQIGNKVLDEIVEVKSKELDVEKPVIKQQFIEHKSQLNIPFNHLRYIDYDYAYNRSNRHSAVKPFVYSNVDAVYDLDAEKSQFLKPDQSTWFGKKLWNEHLLEVQGDGYWFNLDFLLDVQLGKDNSDVKYTYNNTRTLTVNGGFGDKFSFSATVYESQGRFAKYINDYISNQSPSFKPAFSEGLVPGRGKAKGFKTDAFDYPVAEGYISYKPNKFMQFQYGVGKNFIGDGYRSLLLSDNASTLPYLKFSVDFWKFNYTSLWLWGTDARAPVVINNEHARKYMALHYLSINLTDRLNIGLFEAAISKGNNGFDVGFLIH